jgi:hypothetical protein
MLSTIRVRPKTAKTRWSSQRRRPGKVLGQIDTSIGAVCRHASLKHNRSGNARPTRACCRVSSAGRVGTLPFHDPSHCGRVAVLDLDPVRRSPGTIRSMHENGRRGLLCWSPPPSAQESTGGYEATVPTGSIASNVTMESLVWGGPASRMMPLQRPGLSPALPHPHSRLCFAAKIRCAGDLNRHHHEHGCQ